jgi:polysaccharide export outer membrane protein
LLLKAAMKNRSTTLLLIALLSLITASSAAQEAQQTFAAKRVAAGCPAYVKVIGAVRAPLRLELRRRVRLLEALALVGGLTERAGKQVRIIHAAPENSDCERRAASSEDESFEKDVEILDVAGVIGGDEKSNPYLRPGDTVSVPESGVAYIVGAVANPQPIILSEPVTITQAIAKAGGILPRAASAEIRLYRQRAVEAAPISIHVNLEAIRKRRAADILLEAFDVVEVKDGRGHSRPIPLRFPNVKMPDAELPLRVVY